MKNSIINLTEDTQLASKSNVGDTGSAAAIRDVPLAELERTSKHREIYLSKIKNYITQDGNTKAPRRLEPNKA